MDTNFIKKVALSSLILGVAFTATVPSYAAENATVVMTEEGKEKIFTGISKEALHIRSGASVTEKSLAILPKGIFVKGTVYETEATKENPYDEWIKIKYLDVEGYVAKDFLEEVAEQPAKASPAKVKNITPASKKTVVSKKTAVKEGQKPVQKAETVAKKAPVKETPVQEQPVEKAPVKEQPVQESRLAAEEVSVKEETKAPAAEKPLVKEAEVSETNNSEEVWTSGNSEETNTPVKEETVQEQSAEKAPVKEEPVQEEPVQEQPVEKAPEKEEPVQGNNSGSYTTQMQATAYTATGNRTATGTVPKKGTIAVDPDVIPLGTELYVEGYGNGVAEDTGSAVKGNIIDLYMDSEQEARNWGRKNVNVTIYNYK
ncbi:MAG: 3D domain-containing protein [Gallicola sp.]|nr:3D domain-containing protein [Gallicola sp.]